MWIRKSHLIENRSQNARQNHEIKIAKRSFEYVAQFEYLGTIVTNKT
jgi:hypothetical protein